MCTSGTVAQVLSGSDGQPAWSSIGGNIIGLDLVDTGSNRWSSVLPPYDAIAHGITGFAFDIDAVPSGGHLRVGFATVGTEEQSRLLARGHRGSHRRSPTQATTR